MESKGEAGSSCSTKKCLMPACSRCEARADRAQVLGRRHQQNGVGIAHLFDRADECRQCRAQVCLAHVDLARRDRLPIGVVRIRLAAQTDGCSIGLVVTGQILADARGLSDTHHQHAGRYGIKCAGVSDASNPSSSPHTVDYVVRGEASRFVDDQDARVSQLVN